MPAVRQVKKAWMTGDLCCLECHNTRMESEDDREAAGVTNPYKVHQLDAMRLSQRAWDEVSSSSIENCWRHTGIVPELWAVQQQQANVTI
ncbi:hypothetical protein FRC11_009732 [Ceratobasidium sp. 423]|nr:hypothetical protein FRC11_009732 [Ceratobasidium sp. 423]